MGSGHHGILELEGVLEALKSQHTIQYREPFSNTTDRWSASPYVNSYSDGELTTSQGNPFHCWTTVIVKKYFFPLIEST